MAFWQKASRCSRDAFLQPEDGDQSRVIRKTRKKGHEQCSQQQPMWEGGAVASTVASDRRNVSLRFRQAKSTSKYRNTIFDRKYIFKQKHRSYRGASTPLVPFQLPPISYSRPLVDKKSFLSLKRIFLPQSLK